MSLALAVLLACGALQEPSAAPAPAAVAPAVDPAALQLKVDEILPKVAALRGLEFRRKVAAGVHTPEQFLAFARKEFEREYGAGRLQAMGEAYALLGLVEPGTDLQQTFLDLLAGQVGGYYDPASKTFYMISTFNKGGLADLIMAHELTHALDDQYFDLEAMYERAKGNSDREFAVRAVAEGSGMSLMSQFQAREMLAGTLEIDISEFQDMMLEQAQILEQTPPFLVMSLALPYLEGNKFLVRESNLLAAAMRAPELASIQRAFREPPLSSEQVLHFEKYWDPKRRDDPAEVKLPDLSAELGRGWNLADSDTLGELGCYVATAESLPNLADPGSQLTAIWTNDAATGWDGDLYQLYRGPEGARLLVWASVWDSPADRGEFAAALAATAGKRNPGLRKVEQGGDAVVALYSDGAGEAAVDALREAIRACRPDW